MRLLSEVDPHAQGPESVSIVNRTLAVLWVFLVCVSLVVFLVVHILEREARQPLVAPVDYDSVVRWLRGQAVLLATHDLQFVLVQHRDVGDRCRRPVLVLALVFFDEGRYYILELELVAVILVQFILGFESHDIESHHFWKSLCSLLRYLVDGHNLEEAMVKTRLLETLYVTHLIIYWLI